MKSQAAMGLAIIAAISSVTVFGIVFTSLVQQSNIVFRSSTERTIIEASNQLEFIEKALQQSAIYSVYQSVYEILKYGNYPTSECTPETFDNLPYWRTFEETCSPSSEDIENSLEEEVQTKFNEYLTALREKTEKIKVELPNYQPAELELDGNQVRINVLTTEKLKFKTRNMEISDLPQNLEAILNFRIADLINKAIEHFINEDPINETIVQSNETMNEVGITPSVNPNWVNDNLNDGELSGSCQTTNFQICINPDNEPYSYLSKAELLPVGYCQERFVEKIINGVNTEFSENQLEVLIETKSEWINPTIDLAEESICATESEINSTSCNCIRWVCVAPNQVKVGDPEEIRPLDEKKVVGTDPVSPEIDCAQCVSTEGGNCVQYSPKICLEGVPLNGNCLIQTDPVCPAETTLNSASDKCEADPVCSFGSYNTIEDKCIVYVPVEEPCPVGFDEDFCDEVECQCSALAVCPVETTLNTNTDKCETAPTCPEGSEYNPLTDKCEKTIPKECPSGTEEYENTGRCYSTTRTVPICDTYKNLHQKTCRYNYWANANAFVKIKDKENSYPVYDTAEDSTAVRNLELQFYVLSGNIK